MGGHCKVPLLEHHDELGLWCRSRNEVAFLVAFGRVPKGTRPNARRNGTPRFRDGTTGRASRGVMHQPEFL